MSKKFLAVMLVIAIALSSLITGTVFAVNSDFAGGDGTSTNPYIIKTKEQLNNVRKNLSAHYKLENNIVFFPSDFERTGDFYCSGKLWTPIGTASAPFSGTFDGNGKAIYGVKTYVYGKTTSLPSSSSSEEEGWSQDYIIGGTVTPTVIPTVGLFGCNTGVIKNLAVENDYIYGRATNNKPMYVGGIVGYNKGTIESCYVEANVYAGSTSTNYGGGIAGYNNGGTIKNCFALGTMYGYYSGGITGCNSEGTVETCYSIAEAKSTYYKGGILGINISSSVTDCYYADTQSQGTGSGTEVGTPLSAEDMQNGEKFTGFDFETVWTMEGTADYLYPELKNCPVVEMTGISLLKMPDKLEYLEAVDNLDVSGGQIALVYNNGSSVAIDMATEMVSGFDNTRTGPQTITVAYGDFTAQFEVTVTPKSPIEISLNSPPTKIEYLEQTGVLDVTGGSLFVTYNNGTDGIIPITNDMASGFDNNQLGTQTVIVVYEGFTTEFEVTVLEKSLTGISLNSPPSKSQFLQETGILDVTGGSILLTYNNGTDEVIPITDQMVSGFDNTKLGAQKITVAYEGFTTEFEIIIAEKTPVGISLFSLPAKTEYLEETGILDITGGSILVTYNNSTDRIIPITDQMVSGFDNTVVGTNTVTVTYEGFTATFEVEIKAKSVESIEIHTVPDSIIYSISCEPDVTGGKIKAYYNNGTEDIIDLTLSMLSNYSTDTAGKVCATVTFEGKDTTLDLVAYKPGDINGDGDTDMEDVVVLAKFVAGWDVEVISYSTDTNQDSKVNLSDVVHLSRYLAQWEGITLSNKPYLG